jgi:phosphatidylglycerophosphate synthase
LHAVRTGPMTRPMLPLAMLAALGVSVGLGGYGWGAGIICALTMNAALTRGLRRAGAHALGPADEVTLVRAALVAGVAALTADSFTRSGPATMLVALSVAALILDAVDGWVARRTQTASMLGARFDMEVDALLILVLSLYVARSAGGWVLAIGTARYAFVAAGWVLPWLRGSLPTRHWCKVVAATQGIVLVFATAGVLPARVNEAALVLSLALLTESFGREILWLWRHHRAVSIATGAAHGRSLTRAAFPRRQWRWETKTAGQPLLQPGVIDRAAEPALVLRHQ